MNRHKNIFFYCGILMLLSEIWKQWCLTYRLGGGHYNWWYLPFQLCSIPMYACLLLSVVSAEKIRKVLLAFLMDYGLLAGFFTFFDTSGLRYPYAPLTFHSYAWHILLILLGVYAGYTNMRTASRPDYLKATGLYLFCCLIATLLNLALYPYGTINMFYISPRYPMTQKVFRHIAVLFGNNAGIAAYIAATIAGAGIIHLLWEQIKKKREL